MFLRSKIVRRSLRKRMDRKVEKVFNLGTEESDADEGFGSLYDSLKGSSDKENDGSLVLLERKVGKDNKENSRPSFTNYEENTNISVTSRYHENRSVMTGSGKESRTIVMSHGQESRIVSMTQSNLKDEHSRPGRYQQNKTDITNNQHDKTFLGDLSKLAHSKKKQEDPAVYVDTHDKSWMKIPITREKYIIEKEKGESKPFLELEMEILSGENLLPMDLNGFSDPYVKVFQGDTVLYTTSAQAKTLKPVWNDRFKTIVQNVPVSLMLKVFDKDWTSGDDFMGEAEIELDSLELNKFVKMTVELNPGNNKKLKKQVTKKNKSLGSISIRIKLSSDAIAIENIKGDNEQKDETTVVVNNNKEAWKVIPILKENQPMLQTNKHEFSEGNSSVQLLVEEIAGRDWLGMDINGASDPYIKIMQNDKVLYKTSSRKKTVDPIWNHSFKIRLENPAIPLHFRVFDKDWTPNDDFMGETVVDLTICQLDKVITKTFHLDPGNDNYVISEFRKRGSIGKISIRFKLSKEGKMDVSSKQEVGEAGGLSSFPLVKGIQKAKKSFFPTKKDEKNEEFTELRQYNDRTAVVHVVLVEAIDLKSEEEGLEVNPYCKIRLGKEKKISKGINNSFKQGFDFFWKEEDTNNFLQIDMFSCTDKFVGCVDLDLLEIAPEISHDIWLPVKGSVSEGHGHHGKIHIIVTISGSVRTDSPSSLKNWNPETGWEAQCDDRYRVSKSFEDVKDVGMLMVKVLEAKGLYGADWDRNSDTLAVVELKNQRVCTHTLYNSLAPNWQKIFTLKVEDIHDTLEITVLNEKNNGTFINLGQERIPLLSIHSGHQKWYKLKDESFVKKAKGNDAEILLEFYLHWNPIRASLATFKPRKIKYEEKPIDAKFKLSTFKHNKNRVKAAYARLNPVRAKEEIKRILSWENKPKSAFALLGYIYFVWIFQPWMLFFILLIPFIMNMVSGKNIIPDDENDDDEDEVEEKKSLKEQLQAIQTYAETMQNVLGTIAHNIEKVENVFNFSVPFVSFLAFIALSLVTLIIYTFNLRIVLIVLGMKKILNKLIFGPNYIPPSKIASIMSRVPDNEQLNQCRELREKGGAPSVTSTPKRSMMGRRSTLSLASSSSMVSLTTLSNESSDDQISEELSNLVDTHTNYNFIL